VLCFSRRDVCVTMADLKASTAPTTAGSAETEETGTALFRELARVVVELGELGGLRSFTLPYPGPAQIALDRAVLRCLEIDEIAPRSVPELMEWCRMRPAGDRLFGVPGSLISADATLVHPLAKLPTRTAFELASRPVRGSEAEALARLAELERRCEPPANYVRCRRFLAQHPVLHQHDRYRPGWNKGAWSRVKDLYTELPESLRMGDLFLRCGSCGLPALARDREVLDRRPLVTGPDIWCEGETCPDGMPLEVIRSPEQVSLLPTALRVFLALPFRLEEVGFEILSHARIGWEPVQGELCAYRLRGDGLCVQTIHICDRVQPALLAAWLAERADRSPGTAMVVVPQRYADSERYRTSFDAALPQTLKKQTLLSGVRDLVGHVLNKDSGMEGDSLA